MPVDEKKFTLLDFKDFKQALARDLATDLVPDLRDLLTFFGLRPMHVRIVRTRWSGGAVGEGQEYVDLVRNILPTPKVEGMGSVENSVESGGMFEVGTVTVSKINANYTEEELRGHDDDGAPPQSDATVFWEIEFLGHNGASYQRRFHLKSNPEYKTLGWNVSLERAQQDRARNGEMQS